MIDSNKNHPFRIGLVRYFESNKNAKAAHLGAAKLYKTLLAQEH